MADERALFADIGIIAQALKYQIRCGKQWDDLKPAAKEALDLIATAIAHIVSGDQLHWDNIAQLAQSILPEPPKPPIELEREMRRLVREIPKANSDAQYNPV